MEEAAALLNKYWYEFIQIYIVGIFLLSFPFRSIDSPTLNVRPQNAAL